MSEISLTDRISQALLGSKNSADEHLRSIVLCTKGILFLGTPHTGAGLAKWAELMAKSIGFIKQSNSQIIQVLEGDSEVLSRIQTEFHTMLRARAKNGDHPIDITCFFEELGLPGIGIVSIWRFSVGLCHDEYAHVCNTRLFPCALPRFVPTHR